MNTPPTIERFYNELVRVPATTVVVPLIEDVLRRYREHPNIYYNERLGFKIFCPAGWIVDPGTGRIAGEQFDYLVNVSDFISILPDRNATFRPEIDLVVENTGDINFMAYFHLRLNALNRDEIEVAYHLDELFQVVTLRLKQASSNRLHDFQIQKYFIRDGRVYNIIVRGLDPVQMENEPELVEEIKQIVRSFAFVSKASGQKNRLRLITNTDAKKELPGGQGLI
jgi:flagellin-specific chaperone FliS